MINITKIVKDSPGPKPYHGPYPFRGRSIAEIDAELVGIFVPGVGKYQPGLLRVTRGNACAMLAAMMRGFSQADGSPRIMVDGIEFAEREVIWAINALRRALDGVEPGESL